MRTLTHREIDRADAPLPGKWQSCDGLHSQVLVPCLSSLLPPSTERRELQAKTNYMERWQKARGLVEFLETENTTVQGANGRKTQKGTGPDHEEAGVLSWRVWHLSWGQMYLNRGRLSLSKHPIEPKPSLPTKLSRTLLPWTLTLMNLNAFWDRVFFTVIDMCVCPLPSGELPEGEDPASPYSEFPVWHQHKRHSRNIRNVAEQNSKCSCKIYSFCRGGNRPKNLTDATQAFPMSHSLCFTISIIIIITPALSAFSLLYMPFLIKISP